MMATIGTQQLPTSKGVRAVVSPYNVSTASTTASRQSPIEGEVPASKMSAGRDFLTPDDSPTVCVISTSDVSSATSVSTLDGPEESQPAITTCSDPTSTLTGTSTSSSTHHICNQVESATNNKENIPPRANLALRTRYSHYENSLVFVHLALRLVEREGKMSDKQPFAVFQPQPGEEVPPPSLFPERYDRQLPLVDLPHRLSNALRCKYPCYVLALIYLSLIKKKHGANIALTKTTFHRLAVAAVVVAAKFYDDLYFSNEHYAKELGFPLETLNSMEICFLVLLDFDLKVSPAEFRPVLAHFDKQRAEICAPVWCGLGSAFIPSPLRRLGSESVAALAVWAPLAASASMNSPAVADRSLNNAVQAYLASREMRGSRFESEEESLLKSKVTGRSKLVHKLLLQYHDEIRAQRISQQPQAAAPPVEVSVPPKPRMAKWQQQQQRW